MKIIKFRIKNYKSIVDSTDCYLEPNITILAGKNEAGKTAILEALEDFNINKDIEQKAISIFRKEFKPEINITFELTSEHISQIFSKLNISSPKVEKLEIEVIKTYPNIYSISKPSLLKLGLKEDEILEEEKQQIENLFKTIKESSTESKNITDKLSHINTTSRKELTEQITNIKNKIIPLLTEITDENKKNAINQSLTNIENLIQNSSYKEIESKIIEELKNKIPNFILFKSFSDQFPSEITIEQARQNALIKDLVTVTGLNLDLISSGTYAEKTEHKNRINLEAKEEYSKYWYQDFANIYIDWDGKKILFFIKEDDKFYPPEIRSQGKQWYRPRIA